MLRFWKTLPKGGVIIVDDTVLDHPQGEKIGLARFQYSGTHHDVVLGIGLTSLVWSGEKEEHIPINYRFYKVISKPN